MRAQLPLVVRYHGTRGRVIRLLHRCRGSLPNNIFRYFANGRGRTRRLLSFSGFILNVNNISAFGDDRLERSLPTTIPVGHVVLRASDPCVTPIPCHNGHGRDTFIVRILGALTGTCKIDRRRFTRRAGGGMRDIFRLGWVEGTSFPCRVVGVVDLVLGPGCSL